MIVYEFIYNPDIIESCFCTISIHKSKKGAEMAMEFHKNEKKKIWEDERKELVNNKQFYENFIFGLYERWDIRETELKN